MYACALKHWIVEHPPRKENDLLQSALEETRTEADNIYALEDAEVLIPCTESNQLLITNNSIAQIEYTTNTAPSKMPGENV